MTALSLAPAMVVVLPRRAWPEAASLSVSSKEATRNGRENIQPVFSRLQKSYMFLERLARNGKTDRKQPVGKPLACIT